MHSESSFKKERVAGVRPLLTLILSLLLLAEVQAGGLKPIIRDNDENGNFEIDYGGNCSDKCKLEVSTDYGATWSVLTGWMHPPNIPNFVITNQPHGTYQYRIRDVEYDYEEMEQILEFSDPSEVIVGPVSPPPTLEDQLEYEYETRIGDINSDGKQDILLTRTTAAPPNNGTIKSVILEQTITGAFETIVPNTQQLATASSWPLATLEAISSDVNLDGFTDVALKGVGNYISGAYDQLVYSPAVAYTDSPRNVRPITQNFLDFASDLVEFYFDPDFFSDNETQVQVPGGWEAEYDCELNWRGIDGWEWECDVEYVWEEGGLITTYPGQNDAAVGIWKRVEDANAAQSPWQNVVDFFALQLSVNVNIGVWCIDVFGDDDDPECPPAALAQLIVWLTELTEDDRAPSGRQSDVIYVTGHRLLSENFGPKHVALEYRSPSTGITTISAGNSNPAQPSGTLIAALDRKSDKYYKNATYGTVASNIPLEPAAIQFTRMLTANRLYMLQNCAPYLATPIEGVGYNSNSYVAGMIDATSSVATLDWGGSGPPVGYLVPLPSAWFTRSPPECPE